MKKILTPIIIAILIIGGSGAAYNYFLRGPKITEVVLTKSVDDNGKPTAPTNSFTSKDTVYLSAKGKKLAIKEVTVVWYKGKIATENRFKVEKNIEINSSGYFSAKLSVPEGLEEGQYGVTTYSAGSEIIQTTNEFDVKN